MSYLPALPPELRTVVLAAQSASEAVSPATGPADPPSWKWSFLRVRDARPYPEGPAFWAEVNVFGSALSPGGKLVSLALISVSSGHPEQVRVTLDQLAQLTGLPPREVAVAVQELVDTGRLRLAAGEGDPGAGGGDKGGGEADRGDCPGSS